MVTKSTNKQDAFALLLNIARNANDYSDIEILHEKQRELFTFKSFNILYELIFYYGYKNDLDKVEGLIITMLKNFENNKPILQTARTLALKFGVSDKFDFAPYFEKIDTKKQIEYSSNKRIEREVSDMMLSESERAFTALALVDLTNGIAHEYGQPATNIRFNIQYHLNKIAKTDGNLDKKMVENCLNDILKQTERIAELNKRLAPATSSQTNMGVFDFTELLEEVIRQEKIRLSEHNISVKYQKKVYVITFDKTQMRQILSNLMLNSIDSIIEKQKEGIDFSPKIRIDIFGNPKHNTVKVVFSDNGTGISDTIQTRIFNPFYTTKDPDKGQGLGLYIIKNILQKYKGTIRIDTKYKDGASFAIEIPKK